MEQILTMPRHDGEPASDERAIARMIGDVWLSNLVAWATRRASATDVSSQLKLAARCWCVKFSATRVPPPAQVARHPARLTVCQAQGRRLRRANPTLITPQPTSASRVHRIVLQRGLAPNHAIADQAK